MNHTAKDSLHNYRVEGMDRRSRLQHKIGMWSIDALEAQIHDGSVKRLITTIKYLVGKKPH